MSTVAAAPGVSARGARGRVREALRSDSVVLTVVLVWMGALAALTWGTWGDPSMDTGYDLLAASRVAHGELPYGDFVYYYGPLGPLLLGGIYAITGAGIAPAVVLGLVLAVAAVVLSFRLARVFVAPGPAGLAAALVATTAVSGANNSYVLPHSTSAPLALVLALACVLLLIGGRRDGGLRGGLLLAGACAGLVAVTRPETAVALFGGIAIWLVVRAFRATGPARRELLVEAGVLAAPAILIPALVYGAFLPVVSWHDLVFDNLYPQDYLSAAGNVVLHAHAPWTPASFVKLAAHLVLYGAGVLLLLGAARAIGRGGHVRRLVLVLLGAGAVLLLAVLVVRPDTVRYYLQWAWMWVPAGAWIAVVVLARRRDAGGPALLLAGVVAVAATTTYAAFTPFPNALHPDSTAYLMPFAAVFLVWLHSGPLPGGRPAAVVLGLVWIAALVAANAGLVVHDARQETVTVTGANGSLTARPADGPALQGALDEIVRRTHPGDEILLAPQLTALYVLADRRDPLRQLSLLPGMLARPSDERAAISRLGRVRLAVIDRTPQDTYDHGAFGTTFDSRLAAWLRREFRRVRTVSGTGPGARKLDILERTS